MRSKIIAGNWKMNNTIAESLALVDELKPMVAGRPDVEVVVVPSYVALSSVQAALKGSEIGLGAQDMFWRGKGAYTSQISAGMLTDVGVKYVVIGHSEARGRFGVPEPDFDDAILRHFGDSDASVNRKLVTALASGLVPLVCVGETLAERQQGIADAIIEAQVEGALAGVSSSDMAVVVFAYEPVWAIGTGEVCAADEADRICGVIRSKVGTLYGEQVAEVIRVQYGGSVKPDNAADLLSRPNIDGALVGGASLKATDFAAIVNACPQRP